MKKIWLIAIISLIVGANFSYSQYLIKNIEEQNNFSQIPQEKVYLDYTGSLIFSGEYLYYSFYCFNAQTNKLSDFSEIGYVALIDGNKGFILKQKIHLSKGLGQGELFINTDLPSGNYKLIAYTQWMLNSGLPQIFAADLSILNPYKNDQSNLIDNKLSTGPKSSEINVKDRISPAFSLKLDRKAFKGREKIEMEILNLQGRLAHGNYTLKVKKIDDIPTLAVITAEDFGEDYSHLDKTSSKTIGEKIYLPEQNGELIYGKAFVKDGNAPLKEEPLILSFPGNDFTLKFAKTDDQGVFFSYVRENIRDSRLVIQSLHKRNVDIMLNEPLEPNLENLSFSEWRIGPEFHQEIKQRSIHNQIENQFYSVKPDSVYVVNYNRIMLSGQVQTIRLDDYTRFPTFQETILENVVQAGYRRGSDGSLYLKLLEQNERADGSYDDYPLLVLVDGVFIPNHDKIATLDTRKVEEIKIINEQLALSDKIYQGIMAIKTFDGDYFENYDTEYGIKISKQVPLPKKNYYNQKYSNNKADSHIPDYRRILYWEPHIEFSENSKKIEFFTSDLLGHYQIILNGFTSYGKPITVSTTFEVVGEQNN